MDSAILRGRHVPETLKISPVCAPDTNSDMAADSSPDLAAQNLLRYGRLGGVDRAHAESLVRSCRVSQGAADASRTLANWSLLQSGLTAIPLIIADFFSLWFLLYGTTTVIERLCGLPIGLVTRDSSLLASLLLLPIAQLAGLYPAMGTSPAVEFRQLVRSAATALCIFAGIAMLQNFQNWPYFAGSSLLTLLLAVPLLPTSRFVVRAISRRCPWWGSPILIYADSASVGAELYRRLKSSRERGLRPVAVLLDAENFLEAATELDELQVPYFPVQDVLESALKAKATWILVAIPRLASSSQPWNEDDEIDAVLHGIPNRVFVSTLGGFDCGMWDRTHTIGTSSGLLLANSRHCFSTLFMKRFLDFALSAGICLLISPLLIAISIAVRLSSAGPVFYGQRRVGRNGTKFTAWKFRTMVSNADRVLNDALKSNPDFRREWNETHKLKNDPRVTWTGRFLRTTSLDELPQLWNILCGEMSLVGPRPIIDSPTYDATYIRDYPREFSVYASVRPGLTGMWQVTCRNSGVYEMRIYWDMYYVRNWSLWLDLYIILRTIRTVALREGSA